MNDIDPVVISQESAVTAVFTLGSQNGTLAASSVWLELRDSSGIRHALPDGAKLTLLSGNRYYLYTLTGGEKDGKIPLDNFAEIDVYKRQEYTHEIDLVTLTVSSEQTVPAIQE